MGRSEEIDAGRKRRRDFEQNREAILRAADRAFAERGMETSIAAVADLAGVAPATVYRHFPSRADLVNAVFSLRVTAYHEAIEAAQSAEDDTDAFRGTIHAIVELQAQDRSFREIISSRDGELWADPELLRFGEALLAALTRARAGGVVRDDVADADIMVLLIASEGIARPVAEQSRSALRRIVDLTLDGICHDRTTLQGPPLELAQIVDVTRG
ncbi:MAG: TetR/AcrR family transcriptional regulator [Actinobacteria bacterium]|nr:TetR/AcrR family transcriptional regulator [Actinomycetota bacterium]